MNPSPHSCMGKLAHREGRRGRTGAPPSCWLCFQGPRSGMTCQASAPRREEKRLEIFEAKEAGDSEKKGSKIRSRHTKQSVVNRDTHRRLVPRIMIERHSFFRGPLLPELRLAADRHILGGSMRQRLFRLVPAPPSAWRSDLKSKTNKNQTLATQKKFSAT